MRIIGGSLRGQKLTAPEGRGTRPMLDRIREALFNILGPAVDGAAVLDLYAGSGSLGFEALSRGARSCCFVERARAARATILANADRLGCRDSCEVVNQDVDRLEPAGGPFELIFYDPPYARLTGGDRPKVLAVARTLTERDLAPGGTLVFHFPRYGLDPAELARIGSPDVREYGTSALALFSDPE